MKIIKQGQLKSAKFYQCKCRECDTEFAFERGEAEYISDFRDGDCLKIACPLCKEFSYVKV